MIFFKKFLVPPRCHGNHIEIDEIGTVKCRYNAVFAVQEIDRVIAVTAL